jgi:phosphatidylethanolamine-binding protein (PEBP) family uncharacterized protein
MMPDGEAFGLPGASKRMRGDERMKLTSGSFRDGEVISGEFAFAVPNAVNHVSLSSNRNPHLAWEGAPEGTRSFPASTKAIAPGDHSNGVKAHGKPGPDSPGGWKHAINSYTGWFAGDPNMKGDYYGYDGPCPPWNDSIVHHYVFTLYALDVEQLQVNGEATTENVQTALKGHVLAEAKLTGTYSLNPRIQKG